MACDSIDAQFHAQLQLRANSVMSPRFVVVIHKCMYVFSLCLSFRHCSVSACFYHTLLMYFVLWMVIWTYSNISISPS